MRCAASPCCPSPKEGQLPGRGRFFLLNDDELAALKKAKGDPARRSLVEEGMEGSWPTTRTQEADKAWYFLYVLFEFGAFARDPLNTVFASGAKLHRGDSYIINLIPREHVPRVAAAMAAITKRDLRAALGKVDTDYFHSPPRRDKAEADYVLGWFDKIVDFLSRADGHVVFTADMS